MYCYTCNVYTHMNTYYISKQVKFFKRIKLNSLFWFVNCLAQAYVLVAWFPLVSFREVTDAEGFDISIRFIDA